RVRRGAPVGRGLRHPRLGLAPSAAQGGACRLPQCEALVRAVDGAARGGAWDGGEIGLRLRSHFSLSPFLRGEGWGEGPPRRKTVRVGLAEGPPHPDCFAIRPLPASGAR